MEEYFSQNQTTILPIILTVMTGILGLVLALVRWGISWAKAKSAEMDAKTLYWEAMTQQAIDAAQKAAKTAQETHTLLVGSTDVDQKTTEEIINTIARLQEANAKAAEMRQRIRDKIAIANKSDLKDDLDSVYQEFEATEDK